MIQENYDQICFNLEKQELEAPNCVTTADVYGQLLAIYLYQNDLCNAKFLWKRIPANIIASNPELSAIWCIGQNMWKKDLPATYRAIVAYAWTEPILEIIKALEETIRERSFNLIGRSYSTISAEAVCGMTGVKPEDLAVTVAARGWSIADDGVTVNPIPPPKTPTLHASSEDQLFKLTEFVSFLEN